MDNFRIDITSEGDLTPAMRIAFGKYRKAKGYSISPEKGLIFYWAEHERAAMLPFELDAEAAADFARRWLAEQNYGTEPDHDGDNGKGWRLYNEAWGHIGNEWQAFVAVKPAWAMYGK